ncbi:DUF805 domain-containing protein [Nocardia heshunensis]
MGFGAAIKAAFSQYATFSGRATRSEFWWFTLFYYLIIIGGAVLSGALSGATSDDGSPASLLFIVVFIGLFLPSVSVRVRRLHDAGYSGWWLLIAIVPFIGGITLLVFSLQDGNYGPNQYGPDPKNRAPIDFGAPTYY